MRANSTQLRLQPLFSQPNKHGPNPANEKHLQTTNTLIATIRIAMAAAEPPPQTIDGNIFNDDEDLLDDDDSFDDSASSSAAAVQHTPPPSFPSTQVTVAVAGVSDLQQNQPQQQIVVQKKPPAILDDSRKLFQRLWTDADEIELLQGFLEYTTHRGGPNTSFNHHHNDSTAFYDQIRNKFQLDFNKNQLIEKIRRLKKKYRNVINRFASGKDYAFRSPHEQATFEISAKIWGNSVVKAPIVIEDEEDEPQNPNFADCQSPNLDVNSKTPRAKKRLRAGSVKIEEKQQHPVNSNANYNQPVGAEMLMASPVVGAGSMSNVIEETVKSCLTPIFKELLGNSLSSNSSPNVPFFAQGFGMALSPMPLGFSGAMGGAKMTDEKWRNQQILELEVFSKRLELMQDQIKEQLQELRSIGK